MHASEEVGSIISYISGRPRCEHHGTLASVNITVEKPTFAVAGNCISARVEMGMLTVIEERWRIICGAYVIQEMLKKLLLQLQAFLMH